MKAGDWIQGRLRSFHPEAGPEVLFGCMHEDPVVEEALLPADGRALCVLSGGDTALALLRANAARVVAADVNPSQLALMRLKRAACDRGWSLENACSRTVGDALADLDIRMLLPAGDMDLWMARPQQLKRPLASAGLIDERLRWLARRISPSVAPVELRRALSGVTSDLEGGFKRLPWRAAWRLLGFGLAAAFPPFFRRHLVPGAAQRFRDRVERQCLAHDVASNLWLKRLMGVLPDEEPQVYARAWPDLPRTEWARMSLQNKSLSEACYGEPAFHLVAASNILDTQPAEVLALLLQELAPFVLGGGHLVLRSLFREIDEWPSAPPGWHLDVLLTRSMMDLERSPLCQVSAIYVRR